MRNQQGKVSRWQAVEKDGDTASISQVLFTTPCEGFEDSLPPSAIAAVDLQNPIFDFKPRKSALKRRLLPQADRRPAFSRFDRIHRAISEIVDARDGLLGHPARG